MKSLVVFYSRTGTTRVIANKIAALLGADIDRIISQTVYDGAWGFAAGILHSLTGDHAFIENTKISPEKYDLVVVGGPIWAGRIACPVRSYLRQHRASLKKAAYFVTHGGSSPERSLQQMEAASCVPPTATLSVSSAQFSAGSYDEAVRGFVGHIRSTLRSERRAA